MKNVSNRPIKITKIEGTMPNQLLGISLLSKSASNILERHFECAAKEKKNWKVYY